MNPNYDSQGFICSWNGVDLSTGWGEDVFLMATPNGDLTEWKWGADGHAVVSTLANQGGVVEMNFFQTAEALADIAAVAATQQLVGEAYNIPFTGFFLFVDPTGNNESFVAFNTGLTSRGAISHQGTVGERTIQWTCEKLIFGDYASIVSAMSSYLKK